MKFVPRPYQSIAVDFLIENPRCALFAGMGLGKTASVLAALSALQLIGEPCFPVLIVAPLRVARKTWRAEVGKWADFAGLRVSGIIGTRAQREAGLAAEADIFTINYDNLPWLVERLDKDIGRFATIVADESSKLKNFRGSIQTHPKTGRKFLRCSSGKQTGALAKLALRAKRFIGLTGTPAPRSIENLWAQLWFVDFGKRLGRTFDQFAGRYFDPHPSGYGLVPRTNSQSDVQRLIADVCLTINPADWFDLHDPIRTVVKVELSAIARRIYDQMENAMFVEILDAEVEAMNAASKATKCLQLANGALYTDAEATDWAEIHDAKLEALQSIVEEANGAPVLVAYHFKHDLARLLKAFPEGRALDTEQDEDDFKAGRIPVLFAHPSSAGHGIDGFQYACNIIAFFGHWWDLETRLQIIERIGPVRQHQAGLDRPVFIYDIVADDTIDEVVMLRHETKRAVQDLLLDALSTKLNNKEHKNGLRIKHPQTADPLGHV